jgi:hypothetical protein
VPFNRWLHVGTRCTQCMKPYACLQDRMQRLKVLQLLVVENAGKLHKLLDLAAAPRAPSEGLMRSCLIQTPNHMVAVADELQFRMCRERADVEEHLEELLAVLPPSQVSSGFCYSLLTQLNSAHCLMLPDDHQFMQPNFTNNMFLSGTADACTLQ